MAPVAPTEAMLPQPFIEPDRVPKPTDRAKEVAALRAWVTAQTHLPPLSGEWLSDPYIFYGEVAFF